jgi:hypothetical protein
MLFQDVKIHSAQSVKIPEMGVGKKEAVLTFYENEKKQ